MKIRDLIPLLNGGEDNPFYTNAKVQFVIREGSLVGNDVVLNVPVFDGDGFLNSFGDFGVESIYPVSNDIIGIKLTCQLDLKNISGSL